MPFLSKYGVARHIRIPVPKAGSASHAVGADWTPATGDVKISKDGGAAADVTNLPTATAMGNSATWDFSLTATEMQAAQVVVIVADSATKAVDDTGFELETYGHASAQHAVDLSDGIRAGLTALPSAAVGSGANSFNFSAAGWIKSDLATWLTVAPLALSAQQVQSIVPDTQKVDLNTIKTQSVTCAAGVIVLASVGTAATSTAQTGDGFAIVNSGTFGNAMLARTAALPTNFAALGITGGGHITQVDTLTTWTGATPPTGDTYAVVNSGSFGNSQLLAAIQNVQNNTFIATSIPQLLERPDSSSNTINISIVFSDETGSPKNLDSGNPTIALVNDAGTDLSSRLGSITNPATGKYVVPYTNTSTDTLEGLHWDITGTLNSKSRRMVAYTQLVETTASVFTSSDRTALTAIKTKTDQMGFTNSNKLDVAIVAAGDFLQAAADKAWATTTRVLTAGTNIALAKGVGLTGLNDIAATDVWAAGTRTLTAGTNIALAKGTGLTGLNDIAATDVWAAGTRTLTAATNITSTGGTIIVAAGAVTVGTNNDKSGYALTVAPPTLTAIINGVWDATMASHLTSGSTGAALNAAGAAGDPWSTTIPGAYGPGTAGFIVGTNLDVLVSSRMATFSVPTHFGALVIDGSGNLTANITGNLIGAVGAVATPVTVGTNNDKSGYALTVVPPTVAEVVAGVWSVLLSNADFNTAGSIGKLIKDNLDTVLSSRLATTSYVHPLSDSETAAAVWNATMAAYAILGSTGAQLQAAGVAGDPWVALIPGTYADGTAGAVLNAILEKPVPDVRGPGASPVTLTIKTPTGELIPDADVWLTNDASGLTVVAGSLRSKSDGTVTFLLDEGVTYWLWCQKDGTNPILGQAFVAHAD